MLIQTLRLWISLGCSPEEKAHLQPIDIDISIRFREEPLGCLSDNLTDVVCYKTIADKIVASVHNRSFNLIECLAAHIFNIIAHEISVAHPAVVDISVAKPHHPVPHLQKGVVFKYCKSLL